MRFMSEPAMGSSVAVLRALEGMKLKKIFPFNPCTESE